MFSSVFSDDLNKEPLMETEDETMQRKAMAVTQRTRKRIGDLLGFGLVLRVL